MAEMTARDRCEIGYSLFLQRLPMGRAKEVALEMGTTDKEVSELKTQSMERCILMLAHLGLKIVPADSRCMTPVAYAFLTSMHERIVKTNPTLIWDEQE